MKAERLKIVDEFISTLMERVVEKNLEYDDLVSLIDDEDGVYDDHIESKSGLKQLMSFFKNGALDFASLILQGDNDELDEMWGNFSSYDLEELRDDFMEYGLHSLHFRSNMANDKARMAAVESMSRALFNLESEAYRCSPSFPLSPLSSLITSNYNAQFQRCLQLAMNAASSYDTILPNIHQLDKVLGLNLDASVEDSWSLEKAVDYFLTDDGQFDLKFLKTELSPERLAKKVEHGFNTMVYNRGYRIKCDPSNKHLSDVKLMEMLEPTIDRLLLPFQFQLTVSEALKRQVFINFFSAFPSGLKLLDAQPEELQGVILDPALKGNPEVAYFSDTLSGPIHLFAATRSAPYTKRAYHVIEYLKDAGYPIHIDIAHPGVLTSNQATDNLIHHANGQSAVLEAFFSKPRSLSDMPARTTITIAQNYLENYSDAAAVNVIKAALQITHPQSGYAGYREISLKLPSFFQTRPQTIPVFLASLEEDGLISTYVFKACGFGSSQMARLRCPPDELNEFLLGSDLGL